VGVPSSDLASRCLSYSPAGSTNPSSESWERHRYGFRSYERSAEIGHGQTDWEEARTALLGWAVKTRSGFRVDGAHGDVPYVRAGDDYWLVARVGPFTVREPVRIVATVDEPDRCGYAYGTLDGHPVTGEEAFIVRRDAEGTVWFTIRSLTKPGAGPWRAAFRLLLLAQFRYRRRYLSSLVKPTNLG
jgi:uncharacterized protein (UPF0548 family)